MSKRTQFLCYNHEHHKCKETSFIFELKIKLKHHCIKHHQWRAKQRWCITINSTDIHKSLLEHHMLNRNYRFIIDNTMLILLFFLILTQFNTHYESMQDFIYCSERCASTAFFSHKKLLLSALYIITVFNARTLWIYFFSIFSLFHLIL